MTPQHPRQNSDNESYIGFTGPARIDKGLNSLRGILQGIAANRKTVAKELIFLQSWIDEYECFARRHPFNELIPALYRAMEDDHLDQEEVEDLLWLLGNLTGTYYDRATADMQTLQGLLAGVISDGKVDELELEKISSWCDEHEHLMTVWPYDEIRSLIVHVRQDGVVDEAEQALLRTFFSAFSTTPRQFAVDMPLNEVGTPIFGLCAVCPEVVIADRLFCFTGSSKRMTRPQLAKFIEERQGRFNRNVTTETDYLVIGGDGNPCWAFACYGRKVEQAISLRKAGRRILLVHETDFWDACR